MRTVDLSSARSDLRADIIVTLSTTFGLFPASTDLVSGDVLVSTSNQNSNMGAIEHDASEAGSLRTLSGLEEADYGGAHRYLSLERRNSVIEIVSDDFVYSAGVFSFEAGA